MSNAPMRTVLKLARAAAFRAIQPRKQFAWLEDVAQEVALLVWLAQEKGYGSGVLQYRRYAQRALNEIVGDTRWSGKAALHLELSEAPEQATEPAELAPLALCARYPEGFTFNASKYRLDDSGEGSR